MTDNLPPGDNGTGEAQEGAAQPQPWFPPAGEPGLNSKATAVWAAGWPHPAV